MAALWILTMLSCGSCCPSSRYIRKPLSRSDCLCKRHSGTALGNSEPILPGSSRISPPLHHNLCPRYVVEGIQRIVLSRSLGAVCVRRDYLLLRFGTKRGRRTGLGGRPRPPACEPCVGVRCDVRTAKTSSQMSKQLSPT